MTPIISYLHFKTNLVKLKPIPYSESFIDSAKLENTFAPSTNVELPLQFPYYGGSMVMVGGFDKNYFECEVTCYDLLMAKRS